MRHHVHSNAPRFAVAAAVCLAAVGFAARNVTADDMLELVSGAKLSGKILERTAQGVKMEARIGTRTVTSTYPVARIKAIVANGKREELSAGGSSTSPAGTTPPPAARGPASRPAAGNASGLNADGNAKSKAQAQVQALIADAGRTPPDWFQATPLNYPQTLDLTFPQPPPQPGWDSQKNVGQFIWDVINPNPNRWKEGVRFVHHLLVVNKDNPQTVKRLMATLGGMYHNLLEDYARSAFWLEQVASRGPLDGRQSAMLAECYWRLGNRDAAVDLLNRSPNSLQTIKLWADMGETQKALALVDGAARSNSRPEDLWLLGGDACRIAGDYAKALAYYQKAAGVSRTQQNQRTIDRAKESAAAIQLFELSDVTKVPDGRYQAQSLGYEGQIAVEVAVRNKRIEAVRITQHREKQFYSSLTDTPRKIVEKQGVKGVDATSGATITSEAVINATAKALAAAAK